MSRQLCVAGLALISFGLWGCGGGEPVKPVEQAGANNNAGGGAVAGVAGVAPPGLADGGGGAAGAGNMAAGKAAPGAAAQPGAGDSKPAAASGSASAQDLLLYLPEDLKIAAGANIAALSDKSNPMGPQLLEQFQPIFTLLERAEIKVGQIEHLWTGTNRAAGDVIICVRTKAIYDASSVTKLLGAAGKTEKIGRASVHSLPSSPEFNNAVAYVDGKTLLIGRLATLTSALKNPKPGAVRLGLDALAQPAGYYWVSGFEEGSSQKLSIKGLEGIEWLVSGLPKARAMAMGLAPASSGQGGAGGMMGAAGMMSMPGGTAGGHGAPAAGAAPAAGPAPAAGGATPAAGHAGGAGVPGAGAAGYPTAGSATSAAGGSVEVAVAWAFGSEAEATQMEAALGMLRKALEEAAKLAEAAKTAKASAGPAGGHAGGAGPPGGAAAEDMMKKMKEMSPAAGAGQMPGSMPAAQQGPAFVRTNDKLKFTEVVSAADNGPVVKVIAKAVQASGASAIDDGLFNGTLSLLARGFKEWDGAKPDQLVGTRRIANMPVKFGYGWMTELLPYVGHSDVYSKIDFSKSWADPINAPHAYTVIPAFLNPADPRATWDGYPFRGMALSHFAGMSGLEDGRNVVAAELPRSDPRSGIFGYDRIAKAAEITDGTSQTIMIVGTGEVAAPWIQGGGATIRGARQPLFDKYTGIGSKGLPKPGTYVLFADGSARVISGDIDPEVFKAMCTMHGSEQIDLSKLVTQGQ